MLIPRGLAPGVPNQQIEVGPDDSILLRERASTRGYFDAEVVPASRRSE